MTIVVTGLGAVTAVGRTARQTFDRLVAGERGFRELTLFDPGDVRTRLVAEVPDLALSSANPTVSRTSELALIAAREAIADACLDLRTRRVGLVLGGTTAGLLETEPLLTTLLASGAPSGERAAALSRMLSHPLSAPTDRVASELGPFARVRSLSSACSSGANALVVGATWLELGVVDAVVCGAADSLCRITLSGFNALGALDPAGARPFDTRRRGLTLGEGAALVVLERAEDARVRDKPAICTLLGWASRSEAHHITNPEATGDAPFRAMRAALERAGLLPADIDYVNAHGTGTPLNDAMETRALARLFGGDLQRVLVSSLKGMIGHTLAAAGAIEAVITALAIERGVIPPTGGLEDPDPECALHHVLAADRRPVRAALSSSFGFGGMDTALVLGGADRDAPASAPKRTVVVTGLAAVTPAGVFRGEEVADLMSTSSDATSVTLPANALDEDRARRLDRASRIAAVACGTALGAGSAIDVGVVLGIAFGAVDATADYMRRLQDKGPRMVRPADFPSLVPSSPAGYVSIYLGLGGPALVVADLAVSSECAVAQASELIASGGADRLCAGGVEQLSPIIEQVFSVVFGESGDDPVKHPRREGAVALALASEDAGLPALARLDDVLIWRDEDRGGSEAALRDLPAPPGGALVVLSGTRRRAEEIVASSSWSGCPRVLCAAASGGHEAAGGIAIALAAAKIARRDATAVLFVGSARGWAYAGTVWPPDRPS